jgi:hypothetical protein
MKIGIIASIAGVPGSLKIAFYFSKFQNLILHIPQLKRMKTAMVNEVSSNDAVSSNGKLKLPTFRLSRVSNY